MEFTVYRTFERQKQYTRLSIVVESFFLLGV